KRRNSFLEYANDGESQFTHTNILTNRVCVGKDGASQFFCKQADLAVRAHVIVIEITAVQDDEIPDRLKALRHGDQSNWPLHSACDDAHLHIMRARSTDDVWNVALNGIEV